MELGHAECTGQSCIDEILTVYTSHLDRMEELENNLRQLDMWEIETEKILREKEKLRIETFIRDVSYLTTNIDEELLEFEYMKEIALQIREAELWQIEYEIVDIYCIEEVNIWPIVACEKESIVIGKLNICMGEKILYWVISKNKDRIMLLNFKINKNIKIWYNDRYVTT